jgi:hypothetical protein
MSQKYTSPVKPAKNWAVYVLFALAAIAGLLALLDAARYMGWLPIAQLGELSFVLPSAFWFAAIMSAIVGVIWFVVAKWIWDQNPSGLLFVMVIAVVNIIFLFLGMLGPSGTFGSIWPALAINAVALILALLPGTKAAFGNRI